MKLLIGSYNPAKIDTYKYYLSDLALEIVTLSDLNISQEAPEDGDIFEEIAVAKAKFYHKLTGLPTIADDAGLMIDVLNGAPGVKSRVWLGRRMSDEEMIQSVIEKMKSVPEDKRTARLVSVIALAVSDNIIHTQLAQIDGVIAQKPIDRRLDGYPYGSLFYFPQFKKFYIELSDKKQKQINHRKIALLKLKPYLLKLID